MGQAIVTSVTALLISIFLPLYFLTPLSEPAAENVVLVMEQAKVQDEVSGHTIVLSTDGGTVTMDLETYLTGVVLSEMPGSFEPEAWKAQAVAARTFAMRQMEDGKHEEVDLCASSACCQAWQDRETLLTKLGNSGAALWDAVEEAVLQTRGQVLTYDGQLIEAVYFSCSGGSTEDAVAVWGSEVPYLQSVPSYGEETAAKYTSVQQVTVEEFRQIVEEENAQLVLDRDPKNWLGAITLTDGGGVAALEIGGQSFSGTQLRRMFGLNSAKFYVELENGLVTFYVQGYGHRVGMSQYGANAMAKAGKSYEEILKYYYTGVELETKTP